MKVVVLRVLFLVAGTAFLFLSISCSITASVFTHNGDGMTRATTNRRLKENGYALGADKKSQVGNVNLDDYRPIDPVPSSKASIRPGPIQHGTPLMPYIPKPSPPNHPEDGGST